jgi:hypothetical protein
MRGMRDSGIKPGEMVKDLRFTEDTLAVDLVDGRTIRDFLTQPLNSVEIGGLSAAAMGSTGRMSMKI